MNGFVARLAPLIALAALIALWEALVRLLAIPPAQLPAPSVIAATLFDNGP
ncbi:hypothetical protein [Candidatus Rhodoblastus alkanivorans]